MAQTKALFVQEGDDIDYTPASNTTAGAVVALGINLIGVTKLDIAANVLGAIGIKGVVKFPKQTGAIARGAPVYWGSTLSPVTGDASSGAASSLASDGPYAGTAMYAAASGDSYVYVDLNDTAGGLTGAYPPVAVAAAGAAQANAANLTAGGFNLVSAADGTVGVILPAGAGRSLIVKNNANAALKVYPPVGGTINAIAANTNYAMAAFTATLYLPWNASTWHTLPLVAS